MTDDKLARMLGWASVGLGAPLLLAPVRTAQVLGIEGGQRQRAVLAGVGARELAAAAGLLGQRSPLWLWSRVAGDLMDLALLANALRSRPQATGVAVVNAGMKKTGANPGRNRTAAATAAVAAITAVDLYAAATRGRSSQGNSEVTLTAAVTVSAPGQEVYHRWRRLDSLPAFMAHLDEVTTTGPRTSHWRAAAPFGKSVEWDAEITDDVPGERIAWQSLDGSKVSNAGEVRFAPAPSQQDTEIHVMLRYAVPGGKLGQALARYFGEDPHQQLDDDLRRFKQVLETGEVVRSEGAPGGKRARHEFPQHPARPLTDKELAEVRP
jgi:uncharacterized membrane protein